MQHTRTQIAIQIDQLERIITSLRNNINTLINQNIDLSNQLDQATRCNTNTDNE